MPDSKIAFATSVTNLKQSMTNRIKMKIKQIPNFTSMVKWGKIYSVVTLATFQVILMQKSIDYAKCW